MTTLRKELPQHNVVLLADIHENGYSVSYRVVGKLCFEPVTFGSLDKESENPEDVDPLFSGWVKWDGCSDWWMPDSFHACGRDDLEMVGEAMTTCFDWTSELLTTWNN